MELERKLAVADTGFVVALLNLSDAYHKDAARIYEQLSMPILLPQTVLTEVAYLVGKVVGIQQVVQFLRYLPSSRFRLLALQNQDLVRTAEILAKYEDSRIDFVDASVMAVAERYQRCTVLTLDRRDFQLFRPQHCDFFELLP